MDFTKYKLTTLNFLFVHSYNSHNHVINVTDISKILKFLFLYLKSKCKIYVSLKYDFYISNIRDNIRDRKKRVYLRATFIIRRSFSKKLKVFTTNFLISRIVKVLDERT